MKKVFLFAIGMVLSGFAFSQKAVQTQDLDKVKYIETSIDVNNPKDYKVLNVKDAKSGEKFQIATKKVKFRTPKEEWAEGAMTQKAFNSKHLIEVIEKNKDKFFVKEAFESNGTYYILFFPIK